MVGRSFGRCLRNRLLPCSAIRFTTISCLDVRWGGAVLRAVAADFFLTFGVWRSLRITVFGTYQGASTIIRKAFDLKLSKIYILEVVFRKPRLVPILFYMCRNNVCGWLTEYSSTFWNTVRSEYIHNCSSCPAWTGEQKKLGLPLLRNAGLLNDQASRYLEYSFCSHHRLAFVYALRVYMLIFAWSERIIEISRQHAHCGLPEDLFSLLGKWWFRFVRCLHLQHVSFRGYVLKRSWKWL
jgi:hypothetical protein